ncbi:hypothetical protein C0431_09230 [bacterium]|nr:hypothetical protein [bacterium]
MAQNTQSIARLFALTLACATVTTSLAQINVAASANGGVGSQSSVWATQATPDKGNDGNRDGRWDSQSVMHTNFESAAWYKIEFATSSSISQVNLFNRTDSFMERLSPFSVTLSINGNTVWSATNQTFVQNINDGNPFASGMSFDFNPVIADSVMVQLERTEYLHLAELEAIEAVPEPGTMLILTAGGVAILRRRKG